MDGWWKTTGLSENPLIVLRSAEFSTCLTDKNDIFVFLSNSHRHDLLSGVYQPYHESEGCWLNRGSICCILVVEADFPAHNGEPQGSAVVSHSGYRLLEGPVNFGIGRVSELKMIDHSDWLGSNCNDVSAGLGHTPRSP